MEILKTDSVSKIYGKGKSRVMALDNVSISIEESDFVGITGPSGSGKSTLLHILGGLDKPDKGDVLFEGKQLYKLKEKELAIFRRRKIGFVFQFFNLVPVLTVEENIMLPLIMDGRKPQKKYIDELIEMLGLKERRKKLPNTLSGGEQQRTAIGRALASKPSVVFADEPTGNLDTATGNEIIELLKLSSTRYNQTVVVITHDIKVASNCNTIHRIVDGRISDESGVSSQ